MSETAEAPSTAPKRKTPVKKIKAKSSPSAHPKYLDMIVGAISGLKEAKGSSKQAIVKYIVANYKVGDNDKHINNRVKIALKSGASEGVLKQVRGIGACGSFRITEKTKKDKTQTKSRDKVIKKSPNKNIHKKSPAKKKVTGLKTRAKTLTTKKTPKKTSAKKPTPKKTPVKKSTKKSPAKKAAAKTPTKKAASKRKTRK